MHNSKKFYKFITSIALAATLFSLVSVIVPNLIPMAHAAGDGLNAFYASDGSSSKATNWSNKDVVINPITVGICGSEVITSLTKNWSTGAPSPSGCNGVTDNFSMYATGYILAPKAGSVTFTAGGDDAFVLRIGSTTVLSNYGTAASGITGNFTFTAGKIYPIQVFFYENTGAASFDIKWNLTGTNESITTANLGTTSSSLISASQQNSTCQVGSSSDCPAYSAQEIYNLYGTTTDGNYWIMIGGSPTYQYVLMDRSLDTGGWVLTMKGTSTTTNFSYSDTINWTTAATLNKYSIENTASTPSRIGTSNTDGKYDSFNSMPSDRIRAIFPSYAAATYGGRYTGSSYGFIWDEPLSGLQPGAANSTAGRNAVYAVTASDPGYSTNCSLSTATLLTLFASSKRCLFRTPSATYTLANSNTTSYDPIGKNLFTSQNIFRWWGINYRQPVQGGSPNAYHNARWGFGFNENQTDGTDEGSNDVLGGIGLEPGASGSRAAGDYNGCCATTAGVNTQMAFELYAHHADPNLGAPQSLTATRGGDTTINLTWAAPTSVTPHEYIVQYKANSGSWTSGVSTYRVFPGSTGSPSASITGLTAGTTYDFRVFARTLATTQTYDTNSSSTAASVSATAILATPGSISVSATSSTEKSLNVSWGSVSNASSYTVKVYSSSSLGTPLQTITGVTTSSNTGYTINSSNFASIAGNTTYYITITAIGTSPYFDSAESSSSSGTTTLKLGTSTASASATSNTLKSIDASWTSVTNATSYTLKLYASDGTTLLTTISGLTGTTRVLTTTDYSSLADGTSYKVSIQAIGSGNYLSGNESTKASVTTNTKLTISTPSVSATSNTLKSIDVSWTTVANSTSYTINIYNSAGSTLLSSKTGVTTLSTTVTASDYASIADGTSYQISVTAVGSGLYLTSTESTKVSVTTLWPGTTPAFGSLNTNGNGFNMNIGNADTNYTYTATTTAGYVTLGTPGTNAYAFFVTGLDGGQSATVTITATRTGYVTQSASTTQSASAAPASVSCSPTTTSSGGYTTLEFNATSATVDKNCTWTVPTGVTSASEIAIVGGGGGGGYFGNASSGGAGAVLYRTNYPLTPGANIDMTIGAGGPRNGGSLNQGPGINGNNSKFNGIAALGGGGGAGGDSSHAPKTCHGLPGGSGGGANTETCTGNAGASYAAAFCGCSATWTVYGNIGGAGGWYSGGGGAGSAGSGGTAGTGVSKFGVTLGVGGGAGSPVANTGSGGAYMSENGTAGVIFIKYATPTLTTPTTTASATTGTLKSIDVSWGAISGAASYTLKLYNDTITTLLATITSLSGTSKTLTTSDYSSLADNTTYRVSITAIAPAGILDSSESNKAVVTTNAVASTPTISSQPTNQTVNAGSSATFSATVSGNGTLTYQWQVSTNSGSTWNNVSTGTGGTTTSYSTGTVDYSANGYRYKLVVTNSLNGTTATQTSSVVTLTVNKLTQSAITITSTSGTYGTPISLTYSGGSGSGSLTYAATSGTAGCSVSGSTLSFTSAGTCSVTLTIAADNTYASASSSATTITISKASQSTLTITSTTGYYGQTLSLTTSGGSGSGSVTYVVSSSGNTAGCSVSGSSLTVTATGNCSVTATKANDSGYLDASSVATSITINKGTQATLTVTSTNGSFGSNLLLTASGGSSGSITYNLVSSGTAGCSISGTSLSATAVGTCTITATRDGGSYYNSITSASATVTISSAAQLALYITTVNGTGGVALTLISTGGSGTGAVTYSVTNGANTTCSISGSTLTATTATGNPGTCIVTATKAADGTYIAKSSSPTTITFTAYTVTVSNGTTCSSGTLGATDNTNCQPLTLSTSAAPKITSLSTTSGYVGTTITITGTSFTGATKVQFGTKIATTYNVVSATSITATIPSGATTGRIVVATPSGTAFSQVFTILVADTQAPSLIAATVNTNSPTQITLTFDESLAVTSTPTSAFAITVASAAATVSSVSISGSQITITLSASITNGQSVALTYTSPGDATSIQDASGNKTSTIGSTSVTNNVQ